MYFASALNGATLLNERRVSSSPVNNQCPLFASLTACAALLDTSPRAPTPSRKRAGVTPNRSIHAPICLPDMKPPTPLAARVTTLLIPLFNA